MTPRLTEVFKMRDPNLDLMTGLGEDGTGGMGGTTGSEGGDTGEQGEEEMELAGAQ